MTDPIFDLENMEEDGPAPIPLPKIRCLGCKRGLTWADQRAQFGRLRRRGLTTEEAKTFLPRCQKCVTRELRLRRGNPIRNQGAEPVSFPVFPDESSGPPAGVAGPVAAPYPLPPDSGTPR
jgi:hypothetical protein